MTRDLLKDTTSFIGKVFLRDATTGNGKVGVAATAMTGDYSKDNNSAKVPLTFATALLGDAYSPGKWAEIGNGFYFFHYPNAAFTEFGETSFSFRADGAIDAKRDFRVIAIDSEDASAAGLTQLINEIDSETLATDLLGYLLASLDSQIVVRRRSPRLNRSTNDLYVIEDNDYLEAQGKHDVFETDLAGEVADWMIEVGARGLDDRSDVTFPGIGTLHKEDGKLVVYVGWAKEDLIVGKFSWSVRATEIATGYIDTPVQGALTVDRDDFS